MRRRDIRFAAKFAAEAGRFQLAVDTGFQFAEIHLKRRSVDYWEPIAWLASGYPLSYALHFPNSGPLSNLAVANAARLYEELGCATMVIHPPMLTQYGEQLRSLVPAIRLGVENPRLDRTAFDHWADGNEYLTLDVEHLWKYTLRDQPAQELILFLEAFLTRYRDKLIHVHLPGYIPGSVEHHPASRNPALARAVLELLCEADFTGFVVSEIRTELQTHENFQRDRNMFCAWAGLSCAGLAPRT